MAGENRVGSFLAAPRGDVRPRIAPGGRRNAAQSSSAARRRGGVVILFALASAWVVPLGVSAQEGDKPFDSEAFERRASERFAALRAELVDDFAGQVREGLADLAAVRALDPERRAAVERLLDTVRRTPDHHLRHVGVDLETATLLALPELGARLAVHRVIAVGESHDALADHQLQAAIVELLAGHEGGTAVGLEMLPRSHQESLDRYVAGALSEADFLAAVSWKTTWGFDWNLYAGIFRVARARKLPIVGLNLPREVTRAVGKLGLDGVPPEIKAQLPAEIDLTQAAHRVRVGQSFSHPGHGAMSPERLERMYQAMCVWDEAMADRAASFLAEHRDVARIVVLAGRGHVEQGDGIPARAARRGAGSWAVVLPSATDGAHLGRLRAELLRPRSRYLVFVAP